MAPSTRHASASWSGLLCAGLVAVSGVSAQNMKVDFTNKQSMTDAATSLAYNMMTYYNGNQSGQIPGMFPGSGTPTGYYWWETSEAFLALVNYWYYTGNTGYNDVVSTGTLFQVGDDKNFQPQNQTFDLGNDDQAYWGMLAMTMAENKFPNPPKDKPQWLALAQAVFNMQYPRYDASTCGGGLRWQFNPINSGYDYKSSIAQGTLMNIASRLYLFTGNHTYADWAEKLYDWTVKAKLIQDGNVYDGTHVTQNCQDVNPQQYSANAGCFIQATAAMANASAVWNYGDPGKWKTANDALVKRTIAFFFENGVIVERMCEDIHTCNNDMKSYKSDVMYQMAYSAKVYPESAATIMPALLKNAQAAVSVCNCGAPGQCSFKWTPMGTCDNLYGMGQQINALQAVMTQMTLYDPNGGPANEKVGGPDLSVGDANAGSGGSQNANSMPQKPISTGDKAGAGILTTLVVVGLIGGAVWLVL